MCVLLVFSAAGFACSASCVFHLGSTYGAGIRLYSLQPQEVDQHCSVTERASFCSLVALISSSAPSLTCPTAAPCPSPFPVPQCSFLHSSAEFCIVSSKFSGVVHHLAKCVLSKAIGCAISDSSVLYLRTHRPGRAQASQSSLDPCSTFPALGVLLAHRS